MSVAQAKALLQRANAKRARGDWATYVALLSAASDLGLPEAQENLGAWCLEGIRDSSGRWLLRCSPRRAVRLLSSAAQANNKAAMFTLGYCHDVGLGVGADAAQALRWYRRAARAGVVEATMNMAVKYAELGNVQASRRWLRRAADQGHPEARLEIAKSVVFGRYPKKRKQAAIGELRKLARLELEPEASEAKLALADAYRCGAGVKKSERMSSAWRSKAKTG